MAKYKGLIVDDSKGVRTTVAAMLQILGLPKPEEMDGESLIQK